MATGVLLLCDAWFDVVTAHGGRCLVLSITTAVLGEIPIGVLLSLISIRLLVTGREPTPGSGSLPSSLWRTPLSWPGGRTVQADRSAAVASRAVDHPEADRPE